MWLRQERAQALLALALALAPGAYFAKFDAKYAIGLKKTKFREIYAKYAIWGAWIEISFTKFAVFREGEVVISLKFRLNFANFVLEL
jgi:hypothetical protein